MANFTDGPNLGYLTNFNPYVQQLPVEAMVDVGTRKQAQYDQGVQRIQSYVDSVAGIDVIKPVHKQYLQSKLNDLKGNLNKVAAGDFSNYQLVNSVGGMISSVAKDPIVQNAASSTQRYRKGLSEMESAIKEGKSSPANIYNFNKQFNSWMEDADPRKAFTGSYTQYFDVDKFTKETFDAIKPDGYTIDQVYETDSNGVPLKDRSGKFILSPVMSRLKKEGRFPEKVQQTIDHILSDPRVGQQLQISGEYQYRDHSPQYLQQSLMTTKYDQLKRLDDQISELNIKKAKGENVQSKIDALSSDKIKVADQYDKLMSYSPDVIRGMIYSDNVRRTYQSMYTNITEERTQHSNPGWDAQFKMMQEANRMAIHRAEMEEKQKDRINARLIAEGKKKKEEGEDDQNNPTLGAYPSDTDFNELFDKQYERAANNSITAINSFLAATAFSDKVRSGKEVDQYIISRVKPQVDKVYQNLGGKDSGEDYNELLNNAVSKYREAWYLQSLTELNEKPEKLSTTNRILKESAEQAVSNFDKYNSQKQIYDSELDSSSSKTIENIKPLQLQNSKGETITLTKQDQLDFALVYGSPSFGNKEEQRLKKQAQERLASKGIQNILVEAGNRLGDRDMRGYYIDQVKNLYNPEIAKNLEKRAKAIEQRMILTPVATETTLPPKEKLKQKELSGILGAYREAGKNYSPGFMDNVENMQKALETDKVSFKMDVFTDEVTGEQTPVISLFSEGEELGKATITVQEANSLGYNIQNWVKNDQVKAVENKIASSDQFQTSYGDIESIITYRQGDALSGPSYFPQMQDSKVTVKGNVKRQEVFKNGAIKDVYIPYLYMNNGEMELVSDKLGEFNSVDEALQVMKSVNPMLVNAFIKDYKTR